MRLAKSNRLARDRLEQHSARIFHLWYDHDDVYSSDELATDAYCGAWDAIRLRSLRYVSCSLLYRRCCRVLSNQRLM